MNIIKTIESVLNNEQMIDSILKSTLNDPYVKLVPKKIDEIIMNKFSIILQYYIASRDTNMDYSFEEIAEKYSKLQEKNFYEDRELYSNVVINRFFYSYI